MDGRCTCSADRHRPTRAPLFTHACHCSGCQRETGTAFALNAKIETEASQVSGAVEEVTIPSASGKGQVIARCPICRAAVCSHRAGLGRLTAFVGVGTLADPAACPRDVHIFTATKLRWLALDPAIPSFPEFYRRSELWPPESLARRVTSARRAGRRP